MDHKNTFCALATISNSSCHTSPQLSQQTLFFRFLFAYDPVNKAYTPILFLFGTIGNCLSVVVFCKAPSHRYRSSSMYLLALAISDIGYLVNLLIVWLEDAGIKFLTSDGVCPIVMYFGNVACFVSVWLTVSFTAERFYAVCFPLSRPVVCTGARAKKVISILVLLALFIFSYVLIIAHVENFPVENFPVEKGEKISQILKSDTDFYNFSKTNLTTVDNTHETIRVCYVRKEYLYFSSIASHVDSLITFIIPFIVISYLNSRIVHCLWKLKKERKLGVAMVNNTSHLRNYNISSLGRLPTSQSSPEVSQRTTSTTTTNAYRTHSGSCTSINSSPPIVVCNGSFSHVHQSLSFSPLAAEKKVTKTLLLVSTVFLCLNFPAHAIRALIFIQSFWGLETVSHEIQAAQQWANILFNTNYAVNFLLYCVCGINFRKSLLNIFCRKKHKYPPLSKRAMRRALNCPTPQIDSFHEQHDEDISTTEKIVNF